MSSMKCCSKCGQVLTKSNTYRNRQCKVCHSVYQAEWIARPGNREKINAWSAKTAKHYKDKGHYVWILRVLRTINSKKRPLSVPNKPALKYLAQQLEQILTETPLCRYTGFQLVPGSLSLDHKIPVSKRPDLAYVLDNLQWVHKTYNFAKSNMTNQEFLAFCRLIVSRADQVI